MTRLEVLEQRLAALETEVAELRIQIRSPGAEPARRAALGWDPAPTPIPTAGTGACGSAP